MSLERGFGLTTLAVGVALVGTFGRFFAAGWGFLILFPVYFAVFWSHLGIHAWIANRTPPPDRQTIWTILASHVAFLAALWLQADVGDGHSWLVIFVLAGRQPGSQEARPPEWAESLDILYELALFIPLALSYVALWTFRPRTRGSGRTP